MKLIEISCVALCAAALTLTGCEKAPDKKVQQESAPGKITVVAPKEPVQQNDNPMLGYNVKGEAQIHFAPNGEETDESRNVAPYVIIRNTPFEKINKKLWSKRLSKDFIVKCSACHDDYGDGVIGPSLLDKTGDEVYGMIIKYKTDKASNVLMRELVKKMDDKEIHFIANDIANFNKAVREDKERNKK
jgi:cytochrome c553